MQRIFDGHNDVLLRLWRLGDFAGRRFLDGDGEGHLDLPRARAGGLAGGFFAVYVPGNLRMLSAGEEDDGGVVDFPHIGPVDSSDARRISLEMALAVTVEEAPAGEVAMAPEAEEHVVVAIEDPLHAPLPSDAACAAAP